uniref:Uncharacterized protein n=1 Tax=Phlebotomus papatasi TaxID=29031 RepID=A0A1B0DGP0_PHLPP
MGLTKPRKKGTATDVSSDHDASDAHDFVKNHLQPEANVKKFWTASRAERLEGLGTCREYVTEYPILSTVKGYEYFLEDFEEEFPEHHSFIENWSKINRELTAYGLSKNERYFKNLQKEVHEELMGLHVLGFHLAMSSYTSCETNPDGTKRKRNKCTKQEVLNALFIYTRDNRLLLEEVAKYFSKRDKAPILAFVGKSKLNLSEFYVAVDKDVLYSFENVNQTLDAYMKICIICKKTYPVVTAPVWTYIQKYVFQIDDSSDKFLSVFDLHNKITVFIEHENSEDE